MRKNFTLKGKKILESSAAANLIACIRNVSTMFQNMIWSISSSREERVYNRNLVYPKNGMSKNVCQNYDMFELKNGSELLYV